MVKQLSEVSGYVENPITETLKNSGAATEALGTGSPPPVPAPEPQDTVVPGEQLNTPDSQLRPSEETPDLVDVVTGISDAVEVIASGELEELEELPDTSPDTVRQHGGFFSRVLGDDFNIAPATQRSSRGDPVTTSNLTKWALGSTATPPRVGKQTAAPTFIRYANQNATRNREVSPQLQASMSFLQKMGITMEVFSGGQPSKNEGGGRVGSTRHDHGNAADVFFYKDGRKLDYNKQEDLPILQNIIRQARANGITGIGAGPGYMQHGAFHIGFGTEAVWGADGSGSNAPEWLVSAFYS